MVAENARPLRNRSGRRLIRRTPTFCPGENQIQEHERKLSAKIRHQAELSRAADLKRSLVLLLNENFDPMRLERNTPDRFPYNKMLRWEPFKEEIIQRWKRITKHHASSRSIELEANRIVRLILNGDNIVNRIRNTRAATEGRIKKERILIAEKLLKSDVSLRFLDVLPAPGRQKGTRLLVRPEGFIKPGEVFRMSPIDMLDEFHGCLISGKSPYFELANSENEDLTSKCCKLLAAIAQHGEGISQTSLIKRLFSVAGGKRYQQYAEMIGTLLDLGLLRQEGKGPAARLKLGTRPQAKGEVIGRRKKNLPTEIDDNRCDRILERLAEVLRFPTDEPTKSRQPKT